MPLEILEVHFDCASSQNLGGRARCLSRLRSRCGAVRISDMMATFRGRRMGNLVFWWSTFRDWRKGSEQFYTSKCRFRGRSWR